MRGQGNSGTLEVECKWGGECLETPYVFNSVWARLGEFRVQNYLNPKEPSELNLQELSEGSSVLY